MEYKHNKGQQRTRQTVTFFAKTRKKSASLTHRCGRRYERATLITSKLRNELWQKLR